MGIVIDFPVKARVAANDDNPWLSSSPAPESAKVEPMEEPIYAKPCKIVDPISGIEYGGYIVEDEKKPGSRAGLFVLAVIGWLLLLALV